MLMLIDISYEYVFHAFSDITYAKDVSTAKEGSTLTIYHESFKNVSFCDVKPPFSLDNLRTRSIFDWEMDTTKVNR